LLDTNILSEWVKPKPDAGAVAWLAQADEDRVFISALTLMELRYGVERLKPGTRRRQLEGWLEHELPSRFESRILAIDAAVADACGRIIARRESQARPIGLADALIAGTAKVFGLVLVTNNTANFDATIEGLLNPFLST
jgi:predicted nucleic acid-binding protein